MFGVLLKMCRIYELDEVLAKVDVDCAMKYHTVLRWVNCLE